MYYGSVLHKKTLAFFLILFVLLMVCGASALNYVVVQNKDDTETILFYPSNAFEQAVMQKMGKEKYVDFVLASNKKVFLFWNTMRPGR